MSGDLDGLRAAAMGATPGGWVVSGPDACLIAPNPVASWGLAYVTRSQADATYIAAASPDVVLELIARVEVAEAAVARVQEICDLDAGRREVCRFDPDCTCEFKDCYECGKWHNCSHTPLTAVREALEAASDDAGSPVRPADGLSGPEAGRDGEGLSGRSAQFEKLLADRDQLADSMRQQIKDEEQR